MRPSVIRHCRAAATSFVLAAAALAAAADPATDAPALLPEPFSALRLGMDEAAFRAARPDAERDDTVARKWPGTILYEETPAEGPFEFARFFLADGPDGAWTLEGAMFGGEPPADGPAGEPAAAALRDAESRLGPAQRRFELIRWGAVFDVRAWETNGAVAFFALLSRTLDPDDAEVVAGNFVFGAFRRAVPERLQLPFNDISVAILAAFARPASEDSRPFPLVDPLPGTNRIDGYELDGTPVSIRAPADAVLALVSDYGSFPATVESDDFAPGEPHSGFVELGFSGRGVDDIEDPKWLRLSHDCATLRVDEADYLSFSVPEDRRVSLRAAVAALASDPATNAPAAPAPHAESAEFASADSPLASALANGDWLPLVVESVSIDTTAPRELRKNWVVSFSGGIKVRVHSPVKTFGVSADKLPGKRFNVRFADCAAATNALHGMVYAGELEVHPSQSRENPATNAPAASESHAESAESAEEKTHAESAEEEPSPEVAKSTSEVFDEIVDDVIAAVDEGREPDLRIPPADEWGNPFSVTNGADFVKVESFGPDGKRSEDDYLLTVQWGDGFATVRRVYFDEEFECQGEEVDHYDW